MKSDDKPNEDKDMPASTLTITSGGRDALVEKGKAALLNGIFGTGDALEDVKEIDCTLSRRAKLTPVTDDNHEPD